VLSFKFACEVAMVKKDFARYSVIHLRHVKARCIITAVGILTDSDLFVSRLTR
jgi:hypothetical protein